MNKILILAFCLACPAVVKAQQVWTLKACIEYGLTNSHSSVVQLNERKIADAKARETFSAYLPTVTVIGTLDDNLKVQQTVIPAGVVSSEDIRVAFTKQYQVNPMVQLDQTIFDKSLLTGLQQNPYTKHQADLNVVKSEESVIYNICRSYFQIAIYRQQIELLLATKEMYRNQMEFAELQVSRGVKLPKDLERIKVNCNTSLAEIRTAETNLALSERQLKYEMGFPMDGQLMVNPSDDDIELSIDAADSSHQISARNRTEYKLAEVSVKLSELDQRRFKEGIYPRLTAYARYGGIGFGNDLNQAMSTIASYGAIGLKVTIPIVDFKRQAQVAQSRYKLRNVAENLKLEESKYLMELQNAKDKLAQEQLNLRINKDNIVLAQSTVNATQLQYEKGTVDLTELLNAQNVLKESQSKYLNSLYSFFQVRVDLEKAQGTLKVFYQAL